MKKPITLLFLFVSLVAGNANAWPWTSLAKRMEGQYSFTHEVGMMNPDSEDGWEIVEAEDTLSIKKISKNKIKFEFELVATNAHMCGMEGEATKVGKTFVYTEKYEWSENDIRTCRLEMSIVENKILLTDSDGNCREMYCGARAGIDGSTFSMDQ